MIKQGDKSSNIEVNLQWVDPPSEGAKVCISQVRAAEI